MLGRTANGLFWMARSIERAENTARLLDAGLRIALTRAGDAAGEWSSVLASAGSATDFAATGRTADADGVADWLLRAPENPSSVLSAFQRARDNGRMVRTALTREAWESLNEGWMTLGRALAAPPARADLPDIVNLVKRETALFRGALDGTMLINELYDFARLGTFMERADNTARILDVKYYVLLPHFSRVGSSLDTQQWEQILRSVSAHRAFTWAYATDYSPLLIADFLILNRRMPRSLASCTRRMTEHLGHLADGGECHGAAGDLDRRLRETDIDTIFREGLHEFLTDFIGRANGLGAAISREFRFVPD